ncbi:uncharacterized protein LOC111623365 isoform X2 [Centruroides sculpturatus]|uniref:uncharacterized protein LOC111623365 isoform X2 n=1 Tax=Centruroides sculpturatus TaxID=218467 RepID=UPI000C6C8C12|nr:uncharacterized protein LOC111623365 isoform X2 [Centruroides sculpturatus]
MEMIIFKRIYEIPVVKASVDCMSTMYSSIKESRAVPETALTTIEETLANLLNKTKVYSEQLKDEIASVDNYAVQVLDKIETKAPFIMKQPNELLADIRNLYSEISSKKGFSIMKDLVSVQFLCATTVASSLTSKTTKAVMDQLEFAMTYFTNKLSSYLPQGDAATVSKDEALRLKEIADFVQEKMSKIYEVVQRTLRTETESGSETKSEN